jgi:L,D-peptidoglycan transpeptidase YkuD (ErfK/YbiS/YcfS/YnhG family)
MDIKVRPDGRATWDGDAAQTVLGRGGVRADKREGDGATPVGRFPLRRVYWRADRTAEPQTALPKQAIKPDDGWCDDPADLAYNRPVKLPYPARHEKLWRDDHVYDLMLVIGHNDDPVEAGAGSAVFVHLTRPERTPTDGCVAFIEADLRRLLAAAAPGDVLEVTGG